MRTLTMVMRCGVPKDNKENMQFTFVDQYYNFITLKGTDVVKALKANKYNFTNIGVTNGKLISTNGAMDRYTLVHAHTGAVVGKQAGVVLNRVEADGKLLGFTIFTPEGTLAEVGVDQAVKLHTAGILANSKLRNTATGPIIQSINGNYPLRIIAVNKAESGKIELDLIFLGAALGNGKQAVRYAGVIVDTESAADFSKLAPKLEKQNIGIIEKVKERGAEADVADTLGAKRTGTAGVYVVIPFENLVKLAEMEKATLKCSTKQFLIAVTDYDADKEESNITVSNTFKVLNKQEGTKKSEAALKKYVEAVHGKLKGIGIK